MSHLPPEKTLALHQAISCPVPHWFNLTTQNMPTLPFFINLNLIAKLLIIHFKMPGPAPEIALTKATRNFTTRSVNHITNKLHLE